MNDSAKIKGKEGDFFLQNGITDRATVAAAAPAGNAPDLSGFAGRITWVAKDKVKFNIPLTWDLQSTKFLAPGHAIKLVFEKNRFNVPLLARDNNKQLKIKFTDLKIRVRRFRLDVP